MIDEQEVQYRLKHKKCIYCIYSSKRGFSWCNLLLCELKGNLILEPTIRRFCKYYRPDLIRNISN